MRCKLSIITALLVGASSLFAQESQSHMPVSLGFLAGVPVTDMFSAGNTSLYGGNLQIANSPYDAAVPRYEFGVSGEIHLPMHLRLEVDGLYKRAGFSTSTFDTTTSANVWEVPALIKKDISLGHHIHPFVEVGASLRHISTVKSDEFLPGDVVPTLFDNSDALHNRNSYGGVAGFGVTFKRGPVAISPEVRYTRWANESFTAPGLRTNLDQGDVLIGFAF